ncbi:hypothetical protein M569_08681, partial [Genlisea aurea]
IFSERRGQWKAATQSQEFFRTLQRYYSNAYVDAQKQSAINVFLGHFQPKENHVDLLELYADQRHGLRLPAGDTNESIRRSFFKRSLSDGNILRESKSPISMPNSGCKDFAETGFSDVSVGRGNASESIPENDLAYSRYTSSMPARVLLAEMQRVRYLENENDSIDCSNFVDLDWLS